MPAPTRKTRVLPSMGRGLPVEVNSRTRLAHWLAEAMNRAKLNQSALAAKSGVSQAHIQGILSTNRLPEDPRIRSMARALQADVEEGLAALYLDRIERILREAPKRTRDLFERLLR